MDVVHTCVCVCVNSHPSKRRLLVDSMALSTERMACSIDVLTNRSPSLLTAGTGSEEGQVRGRYVTSGDRKKEI